jgi:hypothetical protein
VSVTRTIEDAVVVPAAEVWPRRFLECTPTLGLTPTLPDDEVIDLANEAKKGLPKAFGTREPAREAEMPPSV